MQTLVGPTPPPAPPAPASHGEAPLPTRRDRWPIVVLALALAVIVLDTARGAFDSDAWWHLKSGDLILDEGTLPREDPFAWTAAGRPWRINSWLYDVLAAALRRVGGPGTVITLTLLAVAALGVAFYLLGRRAGARAWPSVAVATVLTVLLVPLVAERPQQVTNLLFAATLMLAPVALRGSNRALAALVVMFVFWVNLHFAFTAGVVLVGLLAVAAASRHHRLRRPALVIGAVFAAGLLNPFGWRAYSAAFETRGTSRLIEEWRRLNPTRPRDLLFLVAIVLTYASIWRTGRWRRLDVVLPVVAFSLLAFDAVRNAPYLLIVAAGELALGCSALRLPRARAWLRARQPIATHGLVVGLAAAAVLGLPALADARPVPGDVYPVRTVAAIPTGCRLLNEYEFGGYITDERWPDVLVSQDGRNGLEQDFERQEEVLEAEAGAREWIDDHGVDCAVVGPDRPIVERLRENGWRQTAADPRAVLLVRP